MHNYVLLVVIMWLHSLALHVCALLALALPCHLCLTYYVHVCALRFTLHSRRSSSYRVVVLTYLSYTTFCIICAFLLSPPNSSERGAQICHLYDLLHSFKTTIALMAFGFVVAVDTRYSLLIGKSLSDLC